MGSARLRAGHARFACEVNPVRDQQQEPTEVIQQGSNVSLDAVGIPLLKQGEDVNIFVLATPVVLPAPPVFLFCAYFSLFPSFFNGRSLAFLFLVFIRLDTTTRHF